jgi:hypothetical protein
MMVPQIKVVVLEDDLSLLQQIGLSLQKSIGNFERHDMNFQVLECSSAADCLRLIKDDGDVQAVIMSWDIRARWEDISIDQEGHIEHNAAIIAAICLRAVIGLGGCSVVFFSRNSLASTSSGSFLGLAIEPL